MAHYVDIETCADALEEEKELCEAVEALVGQAAVSVWSEIVADVNSSFQDARTWLEATFPILIVYQEQHEVLWEHLQALGLILILVAMSFVSLAPWRPRRRKPGGGTGDGSRMGLLQRSNSFGWTPQHRLHHQQQQHTRDACTMSLGRATAKQFFPSPNTSSTHSFPHLNNNDDEAPSSPVLEEEETDEERFAQNYSIMMEEARYSKLLLPPTCRRMEPQQQQRTSSKTRLSASSQHSNANNNKNAPSTHSAKQRRKPVRKKQQKMAAEQSTTSSTTEESSPQPPQEARDNPALRLQIYWRHFAHFLRYLASLDFVLAIWTVILWLWGIWKHRQSANNNQQSARDEETTPASTVAEETKHDEKATEGNAREDEDDVTDATSGIDTTTDDEIISSTRCLSPVQVNSQEQENEEPPPLPPQSDEEGEEEDAFHTPAPASQKRIIQPLTAGAPSLPKDMHPRKSKDGLSPPSPEKSSVAKRISGLLRPRFKKQSSNRSSSSEDMTKDISPKSPPRTLDALDGTAKITADVDNQAVVPKRTAESPFRSIRHFFDPAHNEQSLQQMSVQMPVPDRNGYILGDEFLPSSQQTPLLVFVNSRSGPQQGQLLITQLRRLLNPIQVWDLANGGPEKVLESFCALTRLRILVCGGDGSVSWIISALEKLKLERKWPPIAILPLGTGNDLARVMGWGGGYNNESLIGILEQISESYITLLDRWEMVIDDSGKKKHKNFFNYFGVGADAEAALQVHYLRESRPEWFFSRLVNKAWYGVFGAEDIIKNTSTALFKDIILYADGVEVPLPSDSQGIIVLNIDSYAGGIPIWTHGWRNSQHAGRQPAAFPMHTRPRRASSVHEFRGDDYPLRRSSSMGDRMDSSEDLLGLLTEEERYESVTACDMPASCQDGILEVVSIRSLFHLGQIRVGLSNAQRLCQCRHIKIVTRKKVAFQIDGEPWRQDKCVLEIRRKKDPALMLHRSMEDGAETEMSKLLEWAEERELIDGRVHRILMKEFSRRIESKTRRRRGAGGGVLQHLTRRRGGGGMPQQHIGMSHTASQPNLQAHGPPSQLHQRQHSSTPPQWSSGISF